MRLGPTRVLVAAAATNCALIVAGVLTVPATLGSLAGVGIIAADLGLQIAIVMIAWRGPLSLAHLGQADNWCLAVGVAFALVYVVFLFFEFTEDPLPVTPYEFFVVAAVAAAAPVAVRARRATRAAFAAAWSLVLGTALWSSGLLIIAYSYWGSRGAHDFWLRDGALGDFSRSGTKSLSVFLLQDLQGAVFFHPFLSVSIGVVCGFAVAGALLTATSLRDRLSI